METKTQYSSTAKPWFSIKTNSHLEDNWFDGDRSDFRNLSKDLYPQCVLWSQKYTEFYLSDSEYSSIVNFPVQYLKSSSILFFHIFPFLKESVIRRFEKCLKFVCPTQSETNVSFFHIFNGLIELAIGYQYPGFEIWDRVSPSSSH